MSNTNLKKKNKTKKEVVETIQTEEKKENIELVVEDSSNDNLLKKRGRKPKGGKLVVKQMELANQPQTSSNIILHLKCSLNDLNNYNIEKNKLLTDPMNYNPDVPPEIMTYNESNSFFMYKNNDEPIIENNNNNNNVLSENPFNQYAYSETMTNSICRICSSKVNNETTELIANQIEDDDNINIKDINTKLKNLKINLYKNSLHDKKSACFWCTYEFDNQPCYIPKYEVDEKLFGYGSFCRPECAVAYLMKENIDDSQKFERYHLLNQIYSKVYNFKKSIKPAPNPYYLLDKFYGNLSIQEYRKLLKTEHMLLVIDKPLTRILPELHEDNESMMLNIYGGNKSNTQTNTSGVYKVKRQSEKQQGPTKTSIIRDKFGLS